MFAKMLSGIDERANETRDWFNGGDFLQSLGSHLIEQTGRRQKMSRENDCLSILRGTVARLGS